MGGTKVLWLLRGWKGGLQKFSGKERRRSRGFRSSGRAVGEAAPPPPPFPLNVLSLILSHSLRARVFSHRCRCCCIKKSRRGGGGGLQKYVWSIFWEEEARRGRKRQRRFFRQAVFLSLFLSKKSSPSFFDTRSSPSAHRFSFISMGIGRLAAALSPADRFFSGLEGGGERDGGEGKGKKKVRATTQHWRFLVGVDL